MGKFPFFYQHDGHQCGIACLQMICKWFGRKYSSEDIAELCPATPEGVSLLSISRAAEALGLHTVCGTVAVESLVQIPLPAILHWNQNHFVVIYSIVTKRKKRVYRIADPKKGLIDYIEEEFTSGWISTHSGGSDKGVVLLLSPGPAFGKYKSTSQGETHSLYFLLGYMRRYRALFLQVALGLAAGSLIQLALPFLMQSTVDVGIGRHDIGFVYLVLLGQFVLLVSSSVLDFIRRWLLLHISVRINVSLISDFIAKLLRLPMPFFDSRQTGDLLQRMGDHSRLQNFITTQCLSILFSVVTFIVFSCVLFSYSSFIFGIFIVFSILYVCYETSFLRRRRVLDYTSFEKQAAAQNQTYRMITTMQEIKLQGCTQRKRWEWEDKQADLFGIQLQSLKLQQAEEAGGILIDGLKGIVITVISATAVINGDMTLGMMLSLQYIIGQLSSPVDQMMNFIYSLQDVKISLERINEVRGARNEDSIGKCCSFTDINVGIEIKDIKFKYVRNALSFTLNKVSFYIPRGKVTAIVGASGSGKTTLMKLILGYYPPESGTINVAGASLNQYNMEWWRSQCGVVMQDGMIFTDSIARNIAVSDGEIDTERLLEAAKIACISKFIGELPLKYNTLIGPDGMGLSQGQKQRILIARAVYKQPEFIFLDEATNSLDTNNERTIVTHLNRFFLGRTVLVIAHRLSTIRNADLIVVMQKGCVTEIGNHEELIKKNGDYYNLVKNQLEL